MTAKVCREEDRVWLEGISGWFVGDRESSVHAAQAAVMEAVGEENGYFELLGASALAFRMQVSKDGLCPSSSHSFCGYQCVAGSVNALPWHIKVYEAKADDADAVKAARQAVVESIDRGVPVQYGSEEDGIIVGYQKGGEEWMCFHPLREGGTKTFVETAWPWGVAIFTGPKESVPSKRELATNALKQAVEMDKAGEADGYYLGPKAWDDYIAKLRALQEADEKTQKDSMLGNSWIYECLTQYRRAASQYLRAMADEFVPEVAVHLREAASFYEKMTETVLCDDEHCITTIAPLPWSLKESESWSNDVRADQIRRLEAARPLERAALAEITAALGVM